MSRSRDDKGRFIKNPHPKTNSPLGADPLGKVEHTTLAGKVTIGYEESWDHHSQLDSLSNQLSSLMEHHGLIDVPMNKKKPTWHNRRTGEAALGRRLDRFLIHKDLLPIFSIFRQWVGSGGIFDHLPIYLELAGSSIKPRAPYKFNLT